MASKHGHQRYTIRKRLARLVGENGASVVLTHLTNEGCYYVGSVVRHTDSFLNNQNGFYFKNGIEGESITTLKLPVRGIVGVGKELGFDDSYLSVQGKAHLIFNDTYKGALA